MKGYEFGQAIGRVGLIRAICLWLAEIAGGLVRRRKAVGVLVGVFAVGVWMHGGLPEIHSPHWPQSSQSDDWTGNGACEFPLSTKTQRTIPCKVSTTATAITYVYFDGKRWSMQGGMMIYFIRMRDSNSGYAVVALPASISCWWRSPETVQDFSASQPYFDCRDPKDRRSDESEEGRAPAPPGEGVVDAYFLRPLVN
jgi:hypothetical protein